MRLVGLLLLYATTATALNGATTRKTSLHEAGWLKQSRVDGDVTVSLSLALTQGNPDRAAEYLRAASDPQSAKYGKYWSALQVASAFSTSDEISDLVLRWLSGVGIHPRQVRRIGNDLHVSCPARLAEALLSTEIHHYRQPATGAAIVAYDVYTLPRNLATHLDWVLPSFMSGSLLDTGLDDDLPQARPHQVRKPSERRIPRTLFAQEDCSQATTLSCITDLYHIPLDDGSFHLNNSFGIFAPGWSTWLPDDLDAFFERFRPELTGRRPVVAAINGGYRQTDVQLDSFNLEPNMDMEYGSKPPSKMLSLPPLCLLRDRFLRNANADLDATVALAYPQPVINFQVGGRAHPGNLNTMLAAFDSKYCDAMNVTIDPIAGVDHPDCGTLQPPRVLSISYVWPEWQFPPEYLHRQCLEFLKLGLQGVTVIVSSGDAGPAGHPDGNCIDEITGLPNATVGRFIPAWPASCPWVTAVGGTAINSAKQDIAGGDQPVGWRNQPSTGLPSNRYMESTYARQLGNNQRSSGGGFSNVFPAPDYQALAVEAYLAREKSHVAEFESSFNASGRAYPDVAAVATAVQVVTGGQMKSVYGTSSSAPVFAAIMARVNGMRLRAGKAPVGFINPVLYAHPEVLNDVVLGHNSGCGVTEAFQAADGWDAVTGLGTPHYEKLLDLFMELP